MKAFDLKKHFITALIMFVTVLIYSILKCLKDAMIISHISVEIISTVELYGVLPCAFILTIVYSKLSDHLTRINIYYLSTIFFISFFIIYTVFIYPNASHLSPDLSNLKNNFPFFRYIFTMFEGWCYVIYYIMSELWGGVMIALMFWQLQNQINNLEEAKRTYPIFSFIGELGAVAGAGIMTIIHDIFARYNSWQLLFNALTFTLVLAGITLALLIWFLSNKILTKEYINRKNYSTDSDIDKASFASKLKYVFSSKIFIFILISVICYGISINLVGSVWKKYINVVYQSPQEIIYFMSKIELYRGLSSFITTFIAIVIIRKFSWKFSALITPVCFFVLTLILTLSIICDDYTKYVGSYLSITSLQIIFFLGAIQNIITFATKYEFFEPAKEMAYMTVNEELRTKGKAIVEVIGSRLGKSSGSALQFVILSLMVGSNLLDITPVLLIVCLVFIALWIYSTIRLSKELEA